MILYNGKIYKNKGEFAQALYIEDGIIKAVGADAEIFAAAPADCPRFDLAGRTVVPGFNDSHMHLQNVGQLMQSVQLLGCGSVAQMQQAVRDYIENKKPAPGAVIYGMGWNQDYFAEGRLPTRFDLDAVTTEHPVILERACGHILVCNTAAMEAAGITASTLPNEGGAFDLDENSRLTGIFRENACGQILCIRPRETVETVASALRAAMDYAASCGITSVQTMDLRPGAWRTTLEAYSRLQKENPTLRVYHQCNFQEPEGFEEFVAAGFRTGVGTPFNKLGPLKMFVDGSLGARTAALRQPYNDDPATRGLPTMTQAQLEEMLALAKAHDCQVIVHAIGDGAIQMVLDGYDKIHTPGNPLRLGVVHCQITDKALLQRFAEKDILALTQPIFLHYDMTVLEDRVGKTLASTSYAFETLRRLGVHESFGTDSPVEDMCALHNLYCAVTRKNLSGGPDGGFYPAERMDLSDALDAYTLESAYASFEETVKGRLLPGYYADLAVLSEDIFTIAPERIKDVTVLATMVDGQFVYERAR